MQHTPPVEVVAPTPPRSKSLDQQRSDFTSEGAPLPAKVGRIKPRRQKKNKSFPERNDDPAQAVELERQQDA